MKKIILGLMVAVLAVGILPLLTMDAARADVPKTISFQGELTDSVGAPINSSVSVIFKLYKASSGGSILWSEAQTVTPSDGILSATIGSATAGGIDMPFDTQYWIGVTVGSDAEMSPRIRLTTSPYAYTALYLDTNAKGFGSLAVTETVTAKAFVGNGAGLTGISVGGADTDWVTSTPTDIYHLSGNVGIGTTAPATALDVNGVVTATSFSGSGAGLTGVTVSGVSPANLTSAIASDSIAAGAVTSAKLTGSVNVTDSLVVGDTRLVVLKNGNVGIGTATPGQILDVVSEDPAFSHFRSTAYTSSGGPPSFHIRRAGGTEASPTILGANASIAGIRAWGYDGSAFQPAASFGLGADGTPAGGSMPGKISFLTTPSGSTTLVERMRIDNAGNVGIGIDTPGSKLDVSGGAHISDSFAVGGAAGDSFVVLKNGNVGIGETTPNQILDVSSEAPASSHIQLSNFGNPIFPSIHTRRARGTQAAPTIVADGDNIGGYGAYGYDGSAFRWGAKIDMQVDGTPGAGSMPGRIVMSTTPSGTTSPVQRMRIDNAGNVGLGIDTPGSKLDVSGGAHISDSFAVGGAAGDSFVVLKNGNVGIGTTTPGGKLQVAGNVIVKDTFAVQDTALVVKESGNVGIGTSTPGRELHVYKDPGNANDVGLEIQNGAAGGTQLNIIAGNAAGDPSVRFWDGSSNVMTFKSGNVGINMTAPTNPLEMASGAYVSSGGTWTNASSREYKKDIAPLETDTAMDTLKNLQPVTFKYKRDNEPHVGFIAEDVPDLVATKDRKGLSSMDIVAVLTKVVQEQQAQIDALKTEVEQLKTQGR